MTLSARLAALLSDEYTSASAFRQIKMLTIIEDVRRMEEKIKLLEAQRNGR